MVGICGTIAGESSDVRFSEEDLQWWGDEIDQRYDGNRLSVCISRHEFYDGEQPAETSDVRIWVWGSIVGCDGPKGYRSRSETHLECTDAEYCARLYEQYGVDFVEYLNSEFVVLIYDMTANTATLCTDRLGTRPIFYTRTPDDAFVFSSHLQQLAHHPGVKTSFDQRYLQEYFSFERALGTRTPLSGVEKLPPASQTRIHLSTGEYETEVYWRPEYRPLDRPYSTFVREFADRFERAVSDRTQEDVEYGVLMSGGIDSRIIAAALDPGATGYHMNEWENQEAGITQEVTEMAGHDFEFLRRDRDYQEQTLDRNPPHMNFISSFDQGQATNFRDELSDNIDVLMSGLYSDVLYQHSYIPNRVTRLPILDESISIPLARKQDSINGYVELFLEGHYTRPSKAIPPAYSEPNTSLKELLQDEIHRISDGIESHGVTYPSGTELVRCSYYYPITNAWSYFFHQSLVQMFPYRNPFFDTRLLDLQHRLPLKYHVRTNIVNDALCELHPGLASIRHANNGIAPSSPFLIRHFGKYAYKFHQRYLGKQSEPAELHHTTGSWTDDNELIRTTDFVPATISRHEQMIRDCDWLDWKEVQGTYQRHMDGEDNRTELYPLVTFLEMPVTRSLLREEASAPQN